MTRTKKHAKQRSKLMNMLLIIVSIFSISSVGALALDTPVMIAPANDAVGVTLTPTFRWYPVADATEYILEYAKDSVFTIDTVSQIIEADTSFTITTALGNDTKYYWRVRATSATADGDWSVFWEFTTVAETITPDVPELTEPEANAKGIAVKPTFLWANAANANSYKLQYSTTASFEANTITASATTNTYTVPTSATALQYNTKYYWRVKSLAADTTIQSDWSDTLAFNTQPETLAYPQLKSPINNAKEVDSAPLFTWYSVPNALKYVLQCSETSAFTTKTITIETADTTFLLTDTALKNSTKYYWHVQAVAGETKSGYDSTWSFLTRVPVLTTPELVSPANYAENIAVKPEFSWNEVVGASKYRLQYAADTAISDTTETIISIDVTDIKYIPTTPLLYDVTYSWRVRALSTDTTKNSDWSEARQFKTLYAEPVTPKLVSPSNGSAKVVAAEGRTSFIWDTVANNSIYVLQYSKSSTFPNNPKTTFNRESTSNIFKDSLEYSTTYYWRVKATNNAAQSSWSEAWSFKTAPKDENPGPILIKPAQNAENIVVRPEFTWTATQDAEKYIIEYSTSSAFPTGTVRAETLTNEYNATASLIPSMAYYWHVKTIKDSIETAWSETWAFTTTADTNKLEAPTAIAPTNASVDMSTSLNFTWESISGATSYLIQYSKQESFPAEIATFTHKVTASKYTATEKLDTNAVYYWHVKALKDSGTVESNLISKNHDQALESKVIGESVWSQTWSFTTSKNANKLATPVLDAPINNANKVALKPTFIWDSVSGAKKYTIEYSKSSNFSSPVSKEVTAVTYIATTDLEKDTRYYWHVKAADDNGSSDWSLSWSFTTNAGTPVEPKIDAPTLVAPANNATKVSLLPTFKWNAVTNATGYTLEYSALSSFSGSVKQNVTATEFTVTANFLYNTKYYWRVKAVAADTNRNSEWSVVDSFATLMPTPATVSLLTPANNAINVSTTPTLTWNIAQNADKYIVEYSTSNTFGSEKETEEVTTTSYTISPALNYDTKYYWHVRAINAEGTMGEWSAASSFTSQTNSIIEPNFIDYIKVTPNPINNNGQATLSFTILQSANVVVGVYDALGNLVQTITGIYETGNYSENLNINGLASGNYVCRIIANGRPIATANFVIVK